MNSAFARMLLSALAMSSFAATVAALHIPLRAGLLHAPPFATVERNAPSGEFVFGGLQVELLLRLAELATGDGHVLDVQLAPAPPQYADAFDLVANDVNNNTLAGYEGEWDLMVANFYATPERSLRATLTPAFFRSTISTIKYIGEPALRPPPTESTTSNNANNAAAAEITGAAAAKNVDITTMSQASVANGTVCLKSGTFYANVVRAKFPSVHFANCDTQDTCLEQLRAGACVLYASDELQLRYRAANDPSSFQVTPESFNTQYIVWATSDRVPREHVRWLHKWMYQAIIEETMDQLHFRYFQKELCPVGTAGAQCDQFCDPNTGQADEVGRCVCISTKWAGADCATPVPEDKNWIPTNLKIMAYTMVGVNCVTIFGSLVWMYMKRKAIQVHMAQPFFLCLILAGCFISTLTIPAMAREDNHDTFNVAAANRVDRACMAIPWLYSLGFSITFGTLFAKIRRVYIIFKSAAGMQRKTVTVLETMKITGIVLLLDVTILTAWTVADPLHWERSVTVTDKFGEALESEGSCTCDHWEAWIGTISVLHLTLLGVACYLCYAARDIPTQFSESKYVSTAMFSNLQIFVVGVPILIILGSSDPDASFFIRTIIVWMNDFVVVTLIFGNLIYQVHWVNPGINSNDRAETGAAIGTAIRIFSSVQRERSGRHPEKWSRAPASMPQTCRRQQPLSSEAEPWRNCRSTGSFPQRRGGHSIKSEGLPSEFDPDLNELEEEVDHRPTNTATNSRTAATMSTRTTSLPSSETTTSATGTTTITASHHQLNQELSSSWVEPLHPCPTPSLTSDDKTTGCDDDDDSGDIAIRTEPAAHAPTGAETVRLEETSGPGSDLSSPDPAQKVCDGGTGTIYL